MKDINKTNRPTKKQTKLQRLVNNIIVIAIDLSRDIEYYQVYGFYLFIVRRKIDIH